MRGKGYANTFGRSETGRPLAVRFYGDAAAPLRVLVMGAQHGDETLAQRAAERFGDEVTPPSALRLAIIDTLNPDGAAAGTRENACGVDLNRDHQRLRAAETRALHHLIRAFRPHLVIDVHTYPPRRKHLLSEGLIYHHDVFWDVPTNPSWQHPLRGRTDAVLSALIGGVRARGFSSDRYTHVNTSGRVRHSTPDVIDARNALALRYGLMTLLIEGRRPVKSDEKDRETRTLAALQAALEEALAWASQHQGILTAPAPEPEEVVVRSKYARADTPRTMTFEGATRGEVKEVTLPGKYTPHLEAKAHVTLPRAYAVPKTHGTLLDLLKRHGFEAVSPRGHYVTERYCVERVKPSKRDQRPPRELELEVLSTNESLDDHLLFSTAGVGGAALAVLLEPASKYGLIRFGGLELELREGRKFPVRRVFLAE